MLAINIAGTYPEIQLLYTGIMTPDAICLKVCWLAATDPCIADSPENFLSPLKRFILMKHTTKVILPGHIGKCTGLLFCGEKKLFFIVKAGFNHT